MQDATVFGWAAQSPLRVDTLGSLRELNRRFLDLAAERPRTVPGAGLGGLSPPQRAAAADCPYALFDLRFQDDAHWLARVRSPAWRVADTPHEAAAGTDAAVVEFVHLALFYAWHVASASPVAAQFLLGMRERTASAYARLTVDSLPGLALAEAPGLRSRWHDRDAYWNALRRAACLPGAAALRRVQLGGIQLAAAARLP